MKKVKVYLKKLTLDGEEKKVELKLTPISIKLVNEEEGIIEAYVSMFGNVDSYGDIVEKGAFAEAVKRFNQDQRYPKGVWAHDWSMPIAKTLEMREDDRGLYIKAQFVLTVQKAKEAWDLIKAGVMTDFSFGYTVDEYTYDMKEGIRHLTKLSIFEWSPVLVGANPMATLISAKSAEGESVITEEEREVPESAGSVVPPVKVEEGEKTKIEVEEKAGKVLSAQNKKLIEDAMTEITSVKDEISGLNERLSTILTTFEALIKAAEGSSSGDQGKSLEVQVEQPHRKQVKIALRSAQDAVKDVNKAILRLKEIR